MLLVGFTSVAGWRLAGHQNDVRSDDALTCRDSRLESSVTCGEEAGYEFHHTAVDNRYCPLDYREGAHAIVSTSGGRSVPSGSYDAVGPTVSDTDYSLTTEGQVWTSSPSPPSPTTA